MKVKQEVQRVSILIEESLKNEEENSDDELEMWLVDSRVHTVKALKERGYFPFDGRRPKKFKLESSEETRKKTKMKKAAAMRSVGHWKGTLPGAVFAAGDPHAQEEQDVVGSVDHAALRVLVPLVATVDDGVDGLHVGGEGSDGLTIYTYILLVPIHKDLRVVNIVPREEEDDDDDGINALAAYQWWEGSVGFLHQKTQDPTADLSEPQNKELLISISLLDHISCNGGNSSATDSRCQLECCPRWN